MCQCCALPLWSSLGPLTHNDGKKSITFCSLDFRALDKQMWEESSSGLQSNSLTEYGYWMEMPKASQKSIPNITLCCIEGTIKNSKFESWYRDCASHGLYLTVFGTDYAFEFVIRLVEYYLLGKMSTNDTFVGSAV